MNRKIAMVLACTALAALVGCSKGNLKKNVESGTYLGIIGFNEDLYEYNNGNLDLLKPATRYGAESFIDGLRVTGGTVLYHAVYNAIDNLETAPLPTDLENVSIVTFTDGLDEGSYMLNNKFNNGEDYLAAVEKRLAKEKIGAGFGAIFSGNSSLHITAYSIGQKGNDVVDESKFKSDLRKLATSDENCFMVENMAVVKEKFREIANSLYSENTSQTITLKIPAPNSGQRIRFTFDSDSLVDANLSQIYIEGEFVSDKKAPKLTNITYKGISGTSTEVVGEIDGIRVKFSISGLLLADGGEIPTGRNIKEFKKTGDVWQVNSEFDPTGSTETERIQKSAAIILVLDCSSSLGDDVIGMKEAAKDFVRTLSGASATPSTNVASNQ